MKEKWVTLAKKADFYGLAEKFHIDPVIVRLIRNRDVNETDMEKYLHGSLDDLYDPSLLKGAQEGADLLKERIAAQDPIRIIGDYDIDGVNSTYILYRGLQDCGADVDYAIPHRIKDGYGLNRNLIDLAAQDGRRVILTCDNGIAAAEEIAYAKSLGMCVIVTDHHEVPFDMVAGERVQKLPPADCVIDPKQAGCAYPWKEICGAVVAYKFLQVLYRTMGKEPQALEPLIQFAAFATVGDVMPLQDENRILVTHGLKQMNETKNIGLRALITQNKIEEVQCYHLGFVLGPCVNATGRLKSADEAIRLLLSESEEEAEQIANELISLNNERKILTEQGTEEAKAQIDEAPWKDESVYVVHLPLCHESVAGIIAGRLREAYNKPIFVLTGTGPVLKGSGRSIEAYSMFEEMNCCKDLFTKFGGHPMAAGLSLPIEHLEEMRTRLNQHATLQPEDFVLKRKIDMRMPLEYISERLIDQLRLIEPCGTANPKPVFAENKAVVKRATRMGAEQNHLRLILVGEGGVEMTGLYFREAESFLDSYRAAFGEAEERNLLIGRGTRALPFCYYPSVNTFRGNTSLQVMITGVLFQ